MYSVVVKNVWPLGTYNQHSKVLSDVPVGKLLTTTCASSVVAPKYPEPTFAVFVTVYGELVDIFGVPEVVKVCPVVELSINLLL